MSGSIAARAEGASREARPGLVTLPAHRLLSSAHLVTALLGAGAVADAAAVAREDQPILERMGSPVFSEVIFQVAAAQAFFENGEHERGASTCARPCGRSTSG